MCSSALLRQGWGRKVAQITNMEAPTALAWVAGPNIRPMGLLSLLGSHCGGMHNDPHITCYHATLFRWFVLPIVLSMEIITHEGS